MTYRPASPWQADTPNTPLPRLIDRVFDGTVSPQDGRYMAMAILQLCDDLHELRAVVRAQDERIARLEGGR